MSDLTGLSGQAHCLHRGGATCRDRSRRAAACRDTDQLPNAVRAAVIGNAGTLVVFRVGSRDAELLAPEFRPMESGALADQEPFTAWLRRGIGRDRVFAEPKLYEPLGTAEMIRNQSRQRFGRPQQSIVR